QFFVCLVSLVALFAAQSAIAQKVVTNQNGDKIIIYADGSWRYYDGEEDLITSPVTETVETSAEKYAPLYESEDPGKKKKKKKKKRRKKSSAKRSKASKKPVANEAEELAARTKAVEYAAEVNVKLRELESQLSMQRLQRTELQDQLKTAQTDINTSVDDIISLEGQLEEAKAQEKSTAAKVKEARKTAKAAERMISMTKEKRDKYMARLNGTKMKRIGPKRNSKKAPPVQLEEPSTAFEDRPGGWKMKKEQNVMLHPPKPPCALVNEGMDEFTGRRRKELGARKLFAHTRDALRPYLKDRDYITCMGSLTAVSGAGTFLNLEFVIASELAQREFGVLDKGSSVIIKFISGNTVRLTNTKTDIGLQDKVNKQVTYKGQYTISGSQEKLLRKEEVDRVRVVWGTGYEDYEVYELDFFSDQLKCLD
ncbi:MAG: hypothetical protein AAFV25_19645, partial [Bacteroidota bacterium]